MVKRLSSYEDLSILIAHLVEPGSATNQYLVMVS
jgi:hypothetical protein